MTAIEIQDTYEREQRIREFKCYNEFFAKELYHIYCIAPCPGFVVDLVTGECRQLPLADIWQERINKIEKMRDDFLRQKFSEFYEKSL